MSEATMERLNDVEAVVLVESELSSDVDSPVKLEAAEVLPEPKIATSQRAIGCGAILCAGCPLASRCFSAKLVEASPDTEQTEEPSLIDWQLETDSFDIGQASRDVSDGAPAPIETRAADYSSSPKAETLEMKPMEQELTRTYLVELLDDSIDTVLARSLRQPVIVNESVEPEPITITDVNMEITATVVRIDDEAELLAAPITATEALIETVKPITEVVEPTTSSIPKRIDNFDMALKIPKITSAERSSVTTDIIYEVDIEPAINQMPELPVITPNNQTEENYLISETPALEVIDIERSTIINKPIDARSFNGIVVVDNRSSFGKPEEVTLPTVSPDLRSIEDGEVQETINYIEGLIDRKLPDSDESDSSVMPDSADFMPIDNEDILPKFNFNQEKSDEEFTFVWRGYGDDLDEEHWALDEDLSSLPITKKLNYILVKFLGKHACYALSSAGSSSD